MNSRKNNTPQKPNPSGLDKFKQVSTIIRREWQWLPKLIAIVYCSTNLPSEIGWRVSIAIAVLGNPLDAKELIGKILGSKGEDSEQASS